MAQASIITAVYNGEKYLEETIASVLNQDTDLEYIIIDDASTDKSKEIILDLTDNLKNVHFVEHEINQGIEPTYKEGIRLTTTDFFKILDHDDTLYDKSTIKKQLQFIKQNNYLALVGGDRYNIDDSSKKYRLVQSPIKEIDSNKKLKQLLLFSPKVPIMHGAQLIRKQAWKLLKQELDTHLLFEIAKSDRWKIGCLQEPVLNYRTHADNTSRNYKWRLQDLKKKCKQAGQLYTNPIAIATQQAYWTGIDFAKVLWTSVLHKR
jgi:glycosyltransferase involved in cell wall biosynthesis